MEVVVAFTKGNQCSEDMVSWGSSVVKRLHTNPVGQRVDAESGLLNEEELQDTCVDETSPVVAPEKTSNQAGEKHSGSHHEKQVVAMLKHNNGVSSQVRDVCSGSVLRVGNAQHPAHVRKPKTLSGIVRVSVGVSESVVDSVRVAPPLDGTLHSTGAEKGKEKSHGHSSIISLVRP